jgi:hypothetical protein
MPRLGESGRSCRGRNTFNPSLAVGEVRDAVRPERELRWLGALFKRDLFEGAHYFCLNRSARIEIV